MYSIQLGAQTGLQNEGELSPPMLSPFIAADA